MADGVELRQAADLDQPVIVGVVVDRGRRPDRDREPLSRAGVGPAGVGRRHRHRRPAGGHRGDGDLGPGGAHRSHGRRRGGGPVGQGVALRVSEGSLKRSRFPVPPPTRSVRSANAPPPAPAAGWRHPPPPTPSCCAPFPRPCNHRRHLVGVGSRRPSRRCRCGCVS